MTPTISDNQIVYLDGLDYKRGDIVVATIPYVSDYPDVAGIDMIKRIIGLPGEHIKVTNQGVYINDALLVEPYVDDIENTLLDNTTYAEIILSDNEYFLIGDNRTESFDSRNLGAIPAYYFKYGITVQPNENTAILEKRLLSVEAGCLVAILVVCLILKPIMLPKYTENSKGKSKLTKKEKEARRKMTRAEKAVFDSKHK